MKRVAALALSIGFLALVFAALGGMRGRSPEANSPATSPLAPVARPIAPQAPTPVPTPHNPWEEAAVRRVEVRNPVAARIVRAARAQEGDVYDPSYQSIGYPGGDVAAGRGACTDVVIRALRGTGIDLQQLVHRDMKRDFRRYGDRWNLGRTDKNIDHRRVPNLMTFFEEHARKLPLAIRGQALQSWQPGDIVCWKMSPGVNHIGIVSDGIGARGLPLVIHNAQRCIEQDYLDAWPITGHYRYPD